MFQQFVGINVIFYYSTTLWQAVGFEESQSFMISTITSITNVLVTFIAIALIDKVGRRPLLLTGSFGMAVTLGRHGARLHAVDGHAATDADPATARGASSP